MSTILVTDPNLGKFELYINEHKDKPIWRGNKHDLKVTFYVPEIIGTYRIPAYAILAVVIDPEEIMDDNVIYGMFTLETPQDVSVNYMIQKIDALAGSKILAQRAISNASIH